MRKLQIILPLVALALFALISTFVRGQRNHRHFITAQTRQIGIDLIAATNSPCLIQIGPGLQAELAGLFASTTRVADVLIGDEPSPIGDSSACSRLILKNDSGKSIGIRLKQVPGSERFQILGYWTIR